MSTLHEEVCEVARAIMVARYGSEQHAELAYELAPKDFTVALYNAQFRALCERLEKLEKLVKGKK